MQRTISNLTANFAVLAEYEEIAEHILTSQVSLKIYIDD